jgi:hypothetical protein
MIPENDMCELAAIALRLSETEIPEENTLSMLGILMDLERVLDLGRPLLLLSGSRDTISEVNIKMDRVRVNIRKLIDSLPKQDVAEYMKARARSVEFQFSV